MTAQDASERGRQAFELFHALSSFGWYDEPPILGGPSSVTAKAVPAEPDALLGLARLLAARASQRDYSGEAISETELMAVLWCGYGRIAPSGPDVRATVPSAGGLYPTSIVVLPLCVTGVLRRPHLFDPDGLCLRSLRASMPNPVESWFRTHHVNYGRASAVLLVGSDLDEVGTRYGNRGYRYALLEAGHVVQNMCLAAAGLNLAAVPVGGFDDDIVNEALRDDLTAATRILYALVLGRPDLPSNCAGLADVLGLGRWLLQSTPLKGAGDVHDAEVPP